MKSLKIIAVALLMTALATGVLAQENGDARRLLQAFGIPNKSEAYISLLKRGLPDEFNEEVLSRNAIPATQMLIFAMGELARMREEKALPVLMRSAERDFPPGVKMIVRYDVRNVPRSMQEKKAETYYDYLQYNAVNALGLIGEPEALPVLNRVFENTDSELMKTGTALAMAGLDYGGGVPHLIEQVHAKNRLIASEAASALSFIAGMDLDYDLNTPVIRRKRTLKKIDEWWEANKATFHPDGKKIIRRRREVVPPPPTRLNSVRELILAAGDDSDFDNSQKSFDARNRLSQMGPSIMPQLKALALDVEEDLNVRAEALRMYARKASYDQARKVLKKAEDDENTEIEELAEGLLKFIKSQRK